MSENFFPAMQIINQEDDVDGRIGRLEVQPYLYSDRTNTVAINSTGSPMTLDQYGTGDIFAVKDGGNIVLE